MRKILIPIGALCFIANYSIAQVSTNFNNENIISNKGKFERNYNSTIDFIIPHKNIDSLLLKEKQEVVQLNELKPFRLAVPTKVNLDIKNLVNWVYDKEFAYGKFTIKLSGALSTSISFDKFYLPKNTELFVYNENGNMITGPVTEKENNINGIWGSWVYQGELLTIEIKTPIALIKDLILHSDNVAYGYKEIYKSIKVGGFGQSGPCNINVICPLGNGWDGERNSVSTVLSANGGEFCTGSLVMNTCNTNIPYYLTANHCFNANSNTAGWRFAFQAWSITCPNPGVNTNGVMYNGATLRARNAPSDFCLLELNQIPPANSGLNYSGWNRSATPAQNATGIHHPSGDLMKISRANNPVTVGSFNGTINQHWQSTWSPQNNGSGQTVTAITEGGSSGSPLFDQNHRIIGQLHGGPSFCGSSQPWDFYGRFDLSWLGGGTNATRLSNWLDPTNVGAITTNTTNIINLLPAQLIISGIDHYCTGTSQYTLNVPAGTDVSWQSSNPNIATVSPIGNPATVTRIIDGAITLTATITVCGTPMSITKEIGIGIPNIDFVSFSNGANEEQYFCTSHYGNQFQPFFSFMPENSSIEYRVLSWPSLNVVYTDPYAYPLGSPIPMNYMSTPGSYVVVEIKLTTPCGSTAWMGFEVEYVDCSEPGGGCHDCRFRIIASPNPTVGDLNVAIDKEKPEVKSLRKNDIVKYELYDLHMAQIVKKWTFDNGQNQRTLNVRGIRPGQYILVVTKGKFRQSTQIIIK